MDCGSGSVVVRVWPGRRRAQADDKWWPAKVYNYDSGSQKVVEYSPLAKASKPWNICVLFPHMKDTFWVAVDYGVVEEAKRMGVNMTLYQAGGYENLPKQLSQFDDCMAGNFDAIIVGPISEAGLDKKFAEGVKAGKVIISTVNPVSKSTVTSKMTVDFTTMGVQTGDLSGRLSQGQDRQCRHLPRPLGLGLGRGLPRRLQEGDQGQEQRQGCSATSSAIPASRCNSA